MNKKNLDQPGFAAFSPAQQLIDATLADNGSVLVSAITAWEIAQLIACGGLALAMELDAWLREIAAIQGVSLVPVSVATAIDSVRLPGEFQKDPADRMLVALAREYNAVLVSADEKIQRYPHVRFAW